MKQSLPLCLGALCLAATTATNDVLAQVVSPKGYEKTEAPSSIYRGFGSRSASGWRYMQVHDDLRGARATVREIAFRRDGLRTTSRYPSYEFNVTLIISTAKTDASTMATSFDANHGTNRQTVAVNQVIKMPATAPGRVADNWDYRIKLSSPYMFNGQSGGLCWEAQTNLFRGPSTTVYFDAAWSRSSNPQMAGTPFGEGCFHSQQRLRATCSASSSLNYSSKIGSLRVNGNYHRPNSLAIGIVGFSRTNFGAIPLPFTIPGSSTQYSGPCQLYTGFDLIFAGTTNSTGTTSTTVPIPVDAQYGGVKLFVQLMSQDPDTGAAIDLVTSNGYELQFVPPYDLPPISRCFSTSSLSATGSVTKNFGIVTAIF